MKLGGLRSLPDEFGLWAARGLIPGCNTVNKFGLAEDADSGVITDIWDGANAADGLVTWVAPTQARIHDISASSADDDGSPVGTGAHTIRVRGLASWTTGTEITEDVTLNGLTNTDYYSFYLRSVSESDLEGVTSAIFGVRAGGPLAGDIEAEIPLYKTGWVGIVWDGKAAWTLNEQDGGFWAKIDYMTGDTLKTFPIPVGGATNAQGAVWCETLGVMLVNEHAAGTGEIWELDTNGVVQNFWPTDITGSDGTTPNRQRGIALDKNDVIWVGRGNVDSDPYNHEIFRFNLDGIPMSSVFTDVPVNYSGGMSWINDRLWVNDRNAGLLKIYEYDDADSLHLVWQTGGTMWDNGAWGLAYTGEEVLMTGWQSDILWHLNDNVPSVTAIEDEIIKSVHSFKLTQNYPNPFNPSTTINYSIPKTEDVTLEIYNLLGQKIVTLVDENQTAGKHTVQWNGLSRSGRQVSSGVYFYKLVSGEYSSVKKMMLLR